MENTFRQTIICDVGMNNEVNKENSILTDQETEESSGDDASEKADNLLNENSTSACEQREIVLSDGSYSADNENIANMMDEDTRKEDFNETVIEKITGMLNHLSEQVANMEILFHKRIMHADYEDKIIDQMHAELQKYKEDMYSQLARPILLDIIEVRDSIMKNAEIYRKKPEVEQAVPNKVFADYAYDLQDILEKNNVEIYRSEQGDLFVPVKQRTVKKEVTHNENLHGKIAESLSCGYSYGGRVLSAESVSVYYYKKGEMNESEDNING